MHTHHPPPHKDRDILSHTLALRYLIELLLWSASGVHKQSPKVWQEKIGWLGEKTSVDEFFLCPCKKQLFHLTKSAVNQIAKTVQWIETCLHGSSEEGHDATEKRHAGSWLSRWPLTRNWNGVAGTSPGVPGDILGSYEELRWMEPHMSSPSPCKHKIEKSERSNEVLHLYRWSTHTHVVLSEPTLEQIKTQQKKWQNLRRTNEQKDLADVHQLPSNN